jgi:hypothetical protein
MRNALLFTSALLAALTVGAGAEAAVSFAPYQRFVQSICGDSDCQLLVQAVPANKRLEVESVSCLITVTAGASIDTITAQTGLVSDFFVPTPMRDDRFFAFNTQTKFIVPPGQSLQLSAVASGGEIDRIQCKVAGEMTTFK